MVKPKLISETEVRIQAISVRSWAMKVRCTARSVDASEAISAAYEPDNTITIRRNSKPEHVTFWPGSFPGFMRTSSDRTSPGGYDIFSRVLPHIEGDVN